MGNIDNVLYVSLSAVCVLTHRHYSRTRYSLAGNNVRFRLLGNAELWSRFEEAEYVCSRSSGVQPPDGLCCSRQENNRAATRQDDARSPRSHVDSSEPDEHRMRPLSLTRTDLYSSNLYYCHITCLHNLHYHPRHGLYPIQ